MIHVAKFNKSALTFGGGVIGNTAGSGPVIEGSSPSPRADIPPSWMWLYINLVTLKQASLERNNLAAMMNLAHYVTWRAKL